MVLIANVMDTSNCRQDKWFHSFMFVRCQIFVPNTIRQCHSAIIYSQARKRYTRADDDYVHGRAFSKGKQKLVSFFLVKMCVLC